MRTHATSCMWETSLQNFQILENLLGNIGIFLLLKPNFPHKKFNFLQRLSALFNSFLLSLMAFQFSSTSNFPQRLSSFGEIQENLFTAASKQKITIRALYFPPLAPQAL
jgi:hypothetical protein